jgi:PIN domain nuclease of toxin-antitoxin system
MAFLLDTHVVLWYASEDAKLSSRAREIVDAKMNLFVSIASLWEITIKINIGKLKLDDSFEGLLERLAVMGAEIIPINVVHLQTYINLPFLSDHRDPFDRILISQATNHKLDLVSADTAFDAYSIRRVWE